MTFFLIKIKDLQLDVSGLVFWFFYTEWKSENKNYYFFNDCVIKNCKFKSDLIKKKLKQIQWDTGYKAD